jgi:hypothetical protein
VQDVREGQQHIKRGINLYQELLEHIKSRGPELDPQTIAGHMLRTIDPKTGSLVADEYLIPEIAVFFLAGTNHICHMGFLSFE